MRKKIIRSSLMLFIVLWIAIAVVNFFAPNLYAPAFYGTVTYVEGDPDPNNPAWIEGNYYCVGTPFDCVVVF